MATTRLLLIQAFTTLCLIEAFTVTRVLKWKRRTSSRIALNVERRDFLESLALAPYIEAPTAPTEAPECIRMPLTWMPSLNAYLLYFGLFDGQPERFGAILDTGSPFLTVPSYCSSKWGCFRPELTEGSGYSNTVERFDNNEGTVAWRKAQFSFVEASGSTCMMAPRDLIFGVLGTSLMGGSGGVFLGLIKETDSWIRPSFLGQLNIKAFLIDLASENKSLTLSTQSMMDKRNNDYIPLVSDLYRKYGFPVQHYSAVADSITVNGAPLPITKKPTYVIFDTGVTGMVVSQDLFDERYNMARQNHEKSVWGSVQLSFRDTSGKKVLLEATNPITTPLGQTPGPMGLTKVNLIVMGLAFLDGHTISVDIDDQKLKID